MVLARNYIETSTISNHAGLLQSLHQATDTAVLTTTRNVCDHLHGVSNERGNSSSQGVTRHIDVPDALAAPVAVPVMTVVASGAFQEAAQCGSQWGPYACSTGCEALVDPARQVQAGFGQSPVVVEVCVRDTQGQHAWTPWAIKDIMVMMAQSHKLRAGQLVF
jgi:hypothetical protein